MALQNRHGLMVITNNINVAHILQSNKDIEPVMVGGALRHADGGIVGDAAIEFIRRFRVDYAVMGVSAVDDDGTLLDFDSREVSAAKAIMQRSRHAILVADNMKFARTAPVRIGHLSQFKHLVMDQSPPLPIAALCQNHQVQVIIAADDGNGSGQ